MHKTRNDLNKRVRGKMVELLNSRVADALDLAAQSQQAHWNVRGANFIALHELSDTLHGVTGEAADDMAEHSVALGGSARGTVQTVANSSTLPPYSEKLASSQAHR
jgi:starvation-inducible DNA-binding protein